MKLSWKRFLPGRRSSSEANPSVPPVRLPPHADLAALLHPDDRAHFGEQLETPVGAVDRFGLASLLTVSLDGRGADPLVAAHALAWGGVLVLMSRSGERLQAVQRDLLREIPDLTLSASGPARPIPITDRKRRPTLALALRKTGTAAAWNAGRQTYHVHLAPWRGEDAVAGYVVCKQVPTIEHVADRLQVLDRGLKPSQAEATAVGLVRKGMPLMLTREAAFLKILHRSLPDRVDAGDGPVDPRELIPKVVDLELDRAGLVQAFTMTWLREGRSAPMSLPTFMAAAARMTAAIHAAGVLHLDLRLDNLVLTPRGVGVIDFGSSVRMDEDLASQRIVAKTLGRALSASDLAREAKDMEAARQITAPLVLDHVGKPTPQADVAALAMQLTRLDEHPILSRMVDADRDSDAYRHLARLRRQLLRPGPGANENAITTAAELAAAIEA